MRLRWFPDPNEFLNSYDELHVFVIGFCELFCLWTSRDIPKKVMPLITKEFWYYRLGKFVASLFFIIPATFILLKLLFG